MFSGYVLLSCLKKTQINKSMLNNYVFGMYHVTDPQKQKADDIVLSRNL